MLPFVFPGFEIQEVYVDGTRLCISARSTSPTAECPTCHQISTRLHSYYLRSPADLPVSGQIVHLKLRVRRFRCQNPQCKQQTFAERFPQTLAAHAQRTQRLTAIMTLFALALSGRPGERLVSQVGMPTSADTLLRLVKQAATPPMSTPAVLGVDDFAFRRGKTYGTILVDLEINRPVDLLTERTGDALAHWLRAHPGVKLISRDRSSEYARGASEGAPDAQQIVDRWHVLKNLGEVVLRVVGRTHAALKQRQAASGVPVRSRYKKLRSSSELAASQASRLRRQASYQEVVALYQQGKSMAAIVEQLHLSPTTVRKYVYAGAFPERATHFRRKGQLGPYLPYLERRVQEGCDNASLLWREIREQGFPKGSKAVNTWLREYVQKPGRRSSEQERTRREAVLSGVKAESDAPPTQEISASISAPAGAEETVLLEEPLESPRHLTWLLLRDRASLKKQEQHMLAFIRQERTIEVAYDLAQRFGTMVRTRQPEQLDSWLEAALDSGVPDLRTFAEGLQREYSALKAALTYPYSTGPVEGQINRLKLIKRSMYGRGSFDLLRQRVLIPA
jgi:transposase